MSPTLIPRADITDILKDLAEQDSRDNQVVRGFAPPRIRALAASATQVADEHGLPDIERSRGSMSLDQLTNDLNEEVRSTVHSQVIAQNPLSDLSSIFQSLTYGQMMVFARELKTIEHGSFETPEGVAALLHAWSTNHSNKTATSSNNN